MSISSQSVYIPTVPSSSPTLSRVHRRRDVISESLRESQETFDIEAQPQLLEEDAEGSIVNLIAVNWSEFWKHARIYPEQPVEYADASEHISSRQRLRNEVLARVRERSNAYVSDTDSESDTEENIVILPRREITCRGCKDGQANQMAHMDYGGCLYDVIV